MKKKGVLLISLVIAMVVAMSLLAIGVEYANHALQNIKILDLEEQCDILDRSLESWAKAHRGVQANSIVYTDKGVTFSQQRLYPKNLQDLGELQTRGFFSKNIDLSKFTYTTQDNGTAYQLEVILPDGSTYKSKRSSF